VKCEFSLNESGYDQKLGFDESSDKISGFEKKIKFQS
jgi:hypothetical protein